MNIVLYSPNFYPLTGGLENVVLDLALEFSEAGHAVTVITLTVSPVQKADFPFRILRRPGLLEQICQMRRADLVVQFNVSLKGILPWLFSSRPLVVSHQTANTADMRGRLKTWIANHIATLNIGCSQYMSNQFAQAVTIPNPYDHTVFQVTLPWEKRRRDLVFVGRLVTDKGADLLLNALVELKKDLRTPTLTIVGTGPEERDLQAKAIRLGLQDQVVFAGLKKGAELAGTINAHRIMVIPSVWEEPFGIVALEGLACGCLVIGSKGGGLPEAIGELGMLFPNGDTAALISCLSRVLEYPEQYRPDPISLDTHLHRHRRTAVAKRYLDALIRVISEKNKCIFRP
ncbi:MAG: glycosyltransferase family 4 protein [Saprospirales bacterium]|jgi:glycogen(starch) synthase|nr:glycosyltransferase family 4 protein [Saprospirales bacterium]MBK8922238.1 glycosyltransferase family 4 protein [Saprospirales bacterium]